MATRFTKKWLVLGIDLSIIVVSFVLAYIIRFNLTISFDLSLLVFQLPLVILVAFMAFLITGSYEGGLRYSGNQDVYNIFKAICLSSLLLILLMVINYNLGIYPELSIPLSIIFIHSILSFLGLTGSHYVFKSVYNSIIPKN